MAFKIYNTMARKKEELIPIDGCVERSLLCSTHKQKVLEFYQRISTYPISSTEIRNALGQRKINLEGLPQSVMDYIVDKHLYQR